MKMKRLFVALILGAVMTSWCKAEESDYKPFLTPGKTWCYARVAWFYVQHEGKIFSSLNRYTVKEDINIDGFDCKTVEIYDDLNSGQLKGKIYLYEADRRVYMVPQYYINHGPVKSEEDMHILFDFNGHEGESIEYTYPAYDGSTEKASVKIYDEEYIRPKHAITDLRRLKTSQGRWIEGVGSQGNYFMYPTLEYTDGGEFVLISCYSPELGLIMHNDFFIAGLEPDGISEPESEPAKAIKSGKMYDLTGREIARPEAGQLYVKDGKVLVATGD